MKKTLLSKLLGAVFLLLVLVSNSSKAGAQSVGLMAGADISVACTGGSSYRVRLNIYEDCSVNIPLLRNYEVDVNSNSCGIRNLVVNVIRVSGPRDLGITCPTEPNTCRSVSGGPGFRVSTYEGNITLPQPCTDWTFSFTNNFRSRIIAPLFLDFQNDRNVPIYVQATINNVVDACGSSPQFQDSPVFYYCVNNPATISGSAGLPPNEPGVLTYEIYGPRKENNTPLIYRPGTGLSSSVPVYTSTPLFFSPQNGELRFTPSIDGAASVVTYKVNKVLNGVEVASSMRDFTIYTRNCELRNPEIKDLGAGSLFNLALVPNVTNTMKRCGLVDSAAFVVTIEGTPGLQNIVDVVTNYPRQAYKVITNDVGNIKTMRFVLFIKNFVSAGYFSFNIRARNNACPIVGTASKEFRLEISDGPSGTFSASGQASCTTPIQLTLNPTGGVPPYSVEWLAPANLAGQTTQTVTSGPGLARVKITDATGCFASLEYDIPAVVNGAILVNNSASATANSVCLNTNNKFRLNLVNPPSPPITINRIEWTFPDGTTLTGNPVSKSFNRLIANRSLVATAFTSDGCSYSVRSELVICNDLSGLDIILPNRICQFAEGRGEIRPVGEVSVTCPVDIQIEGRRNGALKTIYSSGNVTSNNFLFYANSDSLQQEYKVTVSRGACIKQFTINLFVEPSIIVDDNKTVPYLCNAATQLTATRLRNAVPPLTYEWSGPNNITGNQNTLVIPTGGFPSKTEDTLNYNLTIRDNRGCVQTVVYELIRTPQANFSITNDCSAGSRRVTFNASGNQASNKTVSLITPTTYEWELGDGTRSTQEQLTHSYAQEGTYQVTLVVRDGSGCVDTMKKNVDVYSNFTVTTILPSNDSICVENNTVFTPPQVRGINYVDWLIDGQPRARVFPTPNNPTAAYVYNDPDESKLRTIEAIVTYNNESCTRSAIKQFRVGKKLDVDFLINGGAGTVVCSDRAAVLTARQLSGNGPIEATTFRWFVDGEQRDTGPRFTYQPPSGGRFLITLAATDRLGCTDTFSTVLRVLLIEPPKLTYTNACVGQPNTFKFTNIPPESFTRYVVDFGDGSPTITRTELTDTLFTKVYAQPNTYTVRVDVYVDQCFSSSTHRVQVFPLPNPRYTVSDLCLRQVAVFNASSSITFPGDSITKYVWEFGDGYKDSSSKAIITHRYLRDGRYPSRLTVVTQAGCRISAIPREVVVKPLPIAGFDVSTVQTIRGTPIQFTDASSGTFAPIRWVYTFGDGNFSTNPNPAHTYTAVGIYTVTQVVSNAFDCSDTISKVIDLNAYLSAPNAFSPNSDNLNDDFTLIKKNIEQVTEFKVYSRTGQVVYDGSSNPDRPWDGRSNGADLQSGIYLLMVKGRSVYGDVLTLNTQLTLLR